MTITNDDGTNDSWVEKYRPDTFSELQGNNKALREIEAWAENWSEGDSPLLLVGPAGTGKTSTAQVVSKELGYPINQINTSSSRGKEAITRMVSSIRSAPSDAEHQLVLLDEVDSWHSSTNIDPLTAVLSSPKNPVIMTANEHWNVPGGLKRISNRYDFKLQKRSRKAKLKEIAANEDAELDDDDLDKLADRPDLRSAINDMQRWVKRGIPPKGDERAWESSPFEVTERLVRGGTETGFDMSPDDLVLWLDQNMRGEFRGVEAAMAWETLAKADEFLYIARKRDYKYWKYAGALVEQTAKLRITDAYDGYMNIDFPEWFKHSEPKAQDSGPTASLYRKLSDYDDGSFRFGGGYTYFRQVLLPLIQELDEDERLQIALQNDLEPKEIKELDLDPAEYDQWSQSDVPDDRQVAEARINSSSALDW